MTKGLVALVESKAAITAVLGNRFYPKMLPQGMTTFPAATYRTVDITPNTTFDGPSAYDFNYIDIHCYARTYGDAVALYQLLRNQLEHQSGLYAGVNIADIWYMSSGQDDYSEELDLHIKQLELKIGTHNN